MSITMPSGEMVCPPMLCRAPPIAMGSLPALRTSDEVPAVCGFGLLLIGKESTKLCAHVFFVEAAGVVDVSHGQDFDDRPLP